MSKEILPLAIFIGGAGDKYAFFGYPPTYIMKNVMTCFINEAPCPVETHYLGFNQKSELVELLISQNIKRPIAIIGHSYGASMIKKILMSQTQTRSIHIDLVITIDPVGWRFIPKNRAKLKSVKHWVNIESRLYWHKRDRSDMIAFLGGHWKQRVQNVADEHWVSPFNHRYALRMLKEYHSISRLSPWQQLLQWARD